MWSEAVSFPPLLLFLLLVLFSVPSGSEHGCSNFEPVECGEFNISYPFWKSSDPPLINYCGYRGFEVTCGPESHPILRLGNYDYRILKIDYKAGVISLADDEIFNLGSDYCPSVLRNVTLSSDVSLSYTNDDVNITFFFNCTDAGESQKNWTFCPHLGKNYVFGENPEYVPQNCGEILVLPVLRSNLTDPSQLGIEYAAAALRRGFELNWSNNTDRFCANCERSGGLCGLNNMNNDPVSACFHSGGKIEGYRSFWIAIARSKGLMIGTIVAAATGIMGGLACYFLIGLQHLRKQREKKEQAIEALVYQYQSTPKRYTYLEIKRMTKSFRDMLGRGGYGSVFKGSLGDGRLVAVKILSESKGNGEEFINEVVSISRTSHVNIVGLLGFCMKGSKRALVYEFMPNGSLEKFIFGGKSNMKNNQLSWEKLYKIAIGIARGLEYLHQGCNTRIVHFDIKPHNILLDQDFHPKISDFGLAKMCLKKGSIISTMGMRGTPGYIAPELFSRTFGVISSKSDVYSYGMMVLEMVGGRKNFDTMADHSSEVYFPDWVYDNFDKYYDLVTPDANLASPKTDANPETKEIARKMIIVGLWCIQIKPENRPSISMVINMLEGSIMDLQMPPKPELD